MPRSPTDRSTICHPFLSPISNPTGVVSRIRPSPSTAGTPPMFSGGKGNFGLSNLALPAGHTKTPAFRARTQRFPAPSFWMPCSSRSGSPLSRPKTRVPASIHAAELQSAAIPDGVAVHENPISARPGCSLQAEETSACQIHPAQVGNTVPQARRRCQERCGPFRPIGCPEPRRLC